MSLVHSARINGHDPNAYLRDVLERLAEATLRATQRASRAFVSGEIANLAGLLSDDRNQYPYRPRLVLKLRNAGKSTAFLQEVWHVLRLEHSFVREIPKSEWKKVPLGTLMIPADGGALDIDVVGKEITFQEKERRNLPLADRAALRFFLYVKVFYSDIFDVRYAREMCIKVFNNKTYSSKYNRETEIVTEAADEIGGEVADETSSA